MLSLLKLQSRGIDLFKQVQGQRKPSISFTGHMTGIKDIWREAELNISVKDCEN